MGNLQPETTAQQEHWQKLCLGEMKKSPLQYLPTAWQAFGTQKEVQAAEISPPIQCVPNLVTVSSLTSRYNAQ
jgi:hypothetical protein